MAAVLSEDGGVLFLVELGVSHQNQGGGLSPTMDISGVADSLEGFNQGGLLRSKLLSLEGGSHRVLLGVGGFRGSHAMITLRTPALQLLYT